MCDICIVCARFVVLVVLCDACTEGVLCDCVVFNVCLLSVFYVLCVLFVVCYVCFSCLCYLCFVLFLQCVMFFCMYFVLPCCVL